MQPMRTSIILFFFVTVFATASAQMVQQIAFREETHDFGVVEEDGGPVTHSFVFTNNGNRDIKIVQVQASCGCTTPDWTREPIAPGEEGFIQAQYNPRGRPGFFNRSLTVVTDVSPEPVTLHIKGRVSSGEQSTTLEFPVTNGTLRLKTRSFNMGKVYLRDINVVREFPVLNAGKAPITFTGKFVHPDHIRLDVQPRTIKPGETATIRLSYNGAGKKQYGFQSDNVEIETTDEQQPVKSFSVFATLEDYFPEMSAEELSRAPQLTLDAHALDFGHIKGEIVKLTQLTNTGREALEIRAVQPNCTCVSVTTSKTSLKPGESADLTIRFNPAERTGSQNKAITIYSNDPKNPVQRLTFKAYVM